MANKYNNLSELFTATANAIRSKTGSTDPIVADDFPEAIEAISSGGGSTEEWFNDGNTHLWITLPEGRTSPMLGVGVKGTVTVDWGDGTEPDVLTGTSEWTTLYTSNHNYKRAGEYVITLSGNCSIGLSGSSNGAYILAASASVNDKVNYTYRNAVRKIEVGNNMTGLSTRAFHGLSSLSNVYTHNGITYLPDYAFAQCRSLTSIVLSDHITRLNASVFSGCGALTSVVLPANISTIPISSFYDCYSLASVAIPDKVTSINSTAFLNCYSLSYVDFSNHTDVPTLGDTSAFTNIPSDCAIRVPAALYDEWIAATNWSTYADYIVGV